MHEACQQPLMSDPLKLFMLSHLLIHCAQQRHHEVCDRQKFVSTTIAPCNDIIVVMVIGQCTLSLFLCSWPATRASTSSSSSRTIKQVRHLHNTTTTVEHKRLSVLCQVQGCSHNRLLGHAAVSRLFDQQQSPQFALVSGLNGTGAK